MMTLFLWLHGENWSVSIVVPKSQKEMKEQLQELEKVIELGKVSHLITVVTLLLNIRKEKQHFLWFHNDLQFDHLLLSYLTGKDWVGKTKRFWGYGWKHGQSEMYQRAFACICVRNWIRGEPDWEHQRSRERVVCRHGCKSAGIRIQTRGHESECQIFWAFFHWSRTGDVLVRMSQI